MSTQTDQSLIEARELIAHLQALGETHKAHVARELHDTIGSLLLAAAMDLVVASAALPGDSVKAARQIKKAQLTLHAAIDQGRKMVEQLRPTILDTFGLFAALQWRVKLAQEVMAGNFTAQYPDIEPKLSEDAAVALFRVAEEAISMTLQRGEVSVANLKVDLANDELLHMEFYDNGVPECIDGAERGAAMALSSMRHRLQLLGGTIEIVRDSDGGTTLRATIPWPDTGQQVASG